MRIPDISKLYELHDYQQETCRGNSQFVHNAQSKFRFIASPTGTGKSFMHLKTLHDHFASTWLIAPKPEILLDMLRKLKVKPSLELAEKYHMTTPIKFLNRLLDGRFTDEPRLLLIDEGHHSEAETYKRIELMMHEDCQYLSKSATPYRGTPQGTAALYAKWGMPEWAITYQKAFERKFISMPNCSTLPLVDDDIIEISSTGEFVISKISREVENKIEDALDQITHWFNYDGTTIRPTLISAPSTDTLDAIKLACDCRGWKTATVTEATRPKQREAAFALCKAGVQAIIHINVVSEGVDLPIRNHLDLSPVVSPLAFLQKFGRGTRPLDEGEEPGEYVCTNRNLERHAYLLEGCLPRAVMTKAQTAFPEPTERIKVRAFGLQSLGKLQGFHIDTVEGLKVTCYNVTQMQGTKKVEYFLILHPQYANPAWFNKVSPVKDDGSLDFGHWVQCPAPTELSGFKSQPPGPLSEKQIKAWHRHADTHGLVVDQKLDAKRFGILHVLIHSGMSFNESTISMDAN